MESSDSCKFVDEKSEGREMPKLFEYLGIVILFYSNEHEPIHVHGEGVSPII